MTNKEKRHKNLKELSLTEDHKKPKPDAQSEQVNHNTKKVSLGPNTSR